MTATAVLPTGFATEIDGVTALVVGVVHSFPSHPRPGALVQPFGGAPTAVEEAGVLGVTLYALVAVEWATEVRTIERDGTECTVFAKGWLGTPQGIGWYLHPAVHDAERRLYLLDDSERFAASASMVDLPAAVVRATWSWGLGAVPQQVKVHNSPL